MFKKHMARNCTSDIHCSGKVGDRTCDRHHHSLIHEALNQKDLAFNVASCKGNRALHAKGIANCGGRSVSLYEGLVSFPY